MNKQPMILRRDKKTSRLLAILPDRDGGCMGKDTAMVLRDGATLEDALTPDRIKATTEAVEGVLVEYGVLIVDQPAVKQEVQVFVDSLARMGYAPTWIPKITKEMQYKRWDEHDRKFESEAKR